MIMKKYILTLVSTALLFTACEKSFDVKDTSNMTGTDASTKVEDDPEFLTSYINGCFAWSVQYATSGQARHDDFGLLGILHNLDLMGLDIAIKGSWNWGRYDINHDYGAFNYVRTFQQWNYFYTSIKKTNEIIDLFGEKDPTDANLRGWLGQAYALRAFCYTYLIQLYQDPVEGTTPTAKFRDSAPAVPIIYSSRDGFSIQEAEKVGGRNTMADLKKEIERNFDLALPLLQGYKRATKNEVNYEVAQGMAARYYLLTQQWSKAITAAQAAQNGFDLMDQKRVLSGFMDLEDREVMWGFHHTTETMTSYASFFSHVSNDSQGYGGVGQSVHCIDHSLYDKIPATDYRKALFNDEKGDPKAATAGAKLPYASRKFGYRPSWLQDYIFMRNAEMILIEAEAHARLSDGQAASTLAKLMAKRDPAWSATNVTVDDVLLQRRIELWCEGFEYFDLRRNGLTVNRKYEGSNHAAAAQYEFPAHSASWNFQIPRQEMQNNMYITEDEQNDWVTGAM